MTLKDSRGMPVSTEFRRSVEIFETAMDMSFRFAGDPLAEIDRALESDPDFVLGHCFRAGLITTCQDATLMPELRRSLSAAEARAGIANDRERQHIGAIHAWARGDMVDSARRYGRILTDYPRDALALQVGHIHDFMLGQTQMLRDRVAQVLPDWSEDIPGYGYLLGMYAFGLEENGDYWRAESVGRRAVELNRRDAWAVHAVAHVIEMQGRHRDGIELLEGTAADWSEESALACHNWWHLALHYLDHGRMSRVLEIFDARITPRAGAPILDLIDGSAMLWRLHLRGIDTGNRWAELADRWEATIGQGYYAFNDAHAMMAFVGADRTEQQERLLATLVEAAGRGDTNAMMTRDVGLPLAQALVAFGQGDYARTVEILSMIRLHAHRFGGSNAQRDIVGLTLIEAALRSGHARMARALANERTALKPGSPHNWRLSARASRAAGEAGQADQADSRARSLAA